MPQRRKHAKSRTGCTECKRRKVKVRKARLVAIRQAKYYNQLIWTQCDESLPVCFNCTRRGANCRFESAPQTNNKGLARIPADLSSTFQAADSYFINNNAAAASRRYTALNLSHCSGSGRGTPSLPNAIPWDREVELMHHWCTVTVDTLAVGPELRHLWRAVMPREGYENRFVMHGVLSMSAMHKAYLVSSQLDTYLNLSAHHQVLGSEGFRAILGNVTGENWRPVFCYAGLLVPYILCLPIRSPNGKLQRPILSLLDLISCMAGVQTAINPFLELVTPSEFYPTVRGLGEAITDSSEG